MRRAEGQVQGGGLPSLMLRNDTSSPTSFPFSCGGTWDEREQLATPLDKDLPLPSLRTKCFTLERSGPKRKHDDTLSEEFLAMLKDAGLESMALEVGTVQGGQIAALDSNKEGGTDPEGKVSRPFSSGEASSPGAMTSSSIFSPNPRVTGPPRESPLLLRRTLGSPVPPESMTASAIFSPSPSTDSGALSYFAESPTAIKGTDMRIVASASESDTPHKSNPKAKRPRRTFDSPAPPQDFSLPEPLPPPLPPPSTRRKRRANRKLCEETSTDTEVSTRRTKKQEAKVGKSLPNKGLRHFSVKVCRKVEEKGTTSYNEVADELVREMASEGDHGNKKDAQYDDKNIRRRVYDALNVLMAIDIISKDRKEITWKGLPECARSGLGALQREKDERERSLEKKKDQLSDLLVQHIACRNLMRKNRALTAARAAALEAGGDTAAMEDAEDVAASKIHLPFIVVSSSDDTVIQCEMAENREDVFFNFSDEFQIADDGEILKRLGMHKCRKQDLPLLIADELIPQVPEDVLIRGHGDRDASSSPPSSPSSSCSNRAPP